MKAQSPAFIPPLDVTINSTPAPGNLFLSLFSLDTADYAPCLLILDSAASPVVFRPESHEIAPPFSVSFIVDFNLQPDGSMTYFKRYPDDRRVIRYLDEDMRVTDTTICADGLRVDTHEALREPDGTTHVFCLEQRIMDISHLVTANGTPGSDSAVVLGNNIQRLDANGNLLWQWRSIDNIPLEDTYAAYFLDPAFLDHAHVNSFEIDTDGHYLVSSRSLNEITKIHRDNGTIIWRFGGKQNDFTLVGDTVPFTGQHDARRLPNGNLSLFDNATTTPNGTARGIEYALDTVNMTATTVWQRSLASGHRSLFIGNMQELPGDHRMINWGGARPFEETISMEEVDANGNTVMSIDLPGNFVSYRARKFDLPFTLPRPAIKCEGNVMTAPAGATGYLWSTGATTPSITFS
ncbi:MAG: aryl-sulfate sulfotransferase, partial [Bacteroidota bacterium]